MSGVAHCATRLRIVLKDNSLADLKKLENVDLVKGAFVAGDQIQLIFGPGLVNDVYEVFSKYVGIADMTLNELKQESAKKQILFKQLLNLYLMYLLRLFQQSLQQHF
ncbi:glucose PTS transporter subunit EIIB [Streptococcus infantarius]|uniref:glucose PTS transporter subunit EIIB n=1 Tax=Streptococcus infantarius TaxID=102684 RepID=UPI003A4D81EA